jgi:hypothetical protein
MKTTTTNGAGAFTTTNNFCLDLFASIGASRNNLEGIKEMFNKAFNEDSLKATAILAYARDIRHDGCGERSAFRALAKELVSKNISLASKLCHLIPELGRWDDMKAFYGTKLEKLASTLWADAILREDVLAAKWAKREDKLLQFALNMNEAKLRKTLSRIRKAHIPEAKMCAKEWNKLEYDKLPSICGLRNAKAFYRNDGVRYQEFLDSKETKVNASVAFPYDVYRVYREGNYSVADKYWANLPDLGVERNILPICDVSGSMHCRAAGTIDCIDIAISLSVYLSQHIKGKFQNTMFTFSEKPTLVTLPKTESTRQLFDFTKRINWGMNTDIEKVYTELLRQAVSVNATQEDMPEALLIISDMQFDSCTSNFNRKKQTILQNMRTKFKAAGYKLPNIIFWQVNASYNNFPSMSHEDGVALISGFSPNIIKPVLNGEIITPVEVMNRSIAPFIEMLTV